MTPCDKYRHSSQERFYQTHLGQAFTHDTICHEGAQTVAGDVGGRRGLQGSLEDVGSR